MILFISSFEVINVVKPDPNIFLWTAASVVDAAAVNPNGMKTLLASSLNKFFVKENLEKEQFLVLVLKSYLNVLLIFVFYEIKFSIILY